MSVPIHTLRLVSLLIICFAYGLVRRDTCLMHNRLVDDQDANVVHCHNNSST